MTDPEARKLLALAMMDAALEAHSSGDPARVQAAQQELHALAALAQLPNLGARMAQRLDEGGAPWEAGEESDWVEAGLALDFAESDWRKERAPRGTSDRRWVNIHTGRVVYLDTNPGAPRGRGRRGQGAQPAAATRPATPSPTAARPQTAGSVQEALGRITGGSQSTPADLHTLLEGLPSLTVAQLRQARQQLQASFGGATRKEGMVDALRGHVQGMLDRQAPTPAPTPPTPTTPTAPGRPGARQPGDVWQGASGRWFTMRADRQVVQTAAPGSEPGAGRGQSRAQQPEQASRTIDPQAIINAMHDEEPQLSSGAPVLLRDLRKRMGPGIPKQDFDRAIIDMAERGQIVLHRHDQPSFLTPAERQQLVQDEDGTYYTLVGFRAGQVLPRQDSVTPDDVGIDLSPTPEDVGLPTDPGELERALQAGLDEDEPAVAEVIPDKDEPKPPPKPPVSSSEAAVSRVVDGVLQGRYTSQMDLEVALLKLKLPQQQQVATLLGVQPTEDMRQSANEADHAWALSQAVMDQMHGVEEPLTAEMVNEDEGIDLSGSGGTAQPVAPTIQALSPARPGGPQIAPITGRAEDAPHLPEGVSYVDAVPAAVRAVFGRDIDPRLLAAAGNATDEAYVTVTYGNGSSPEGAFFMMSSESGVVSASRTFHRHPNGEIEVHNDIQRIKPGHAGVGVNIFLNQVRALRAAGVTYITTTAVGDVRQSVTDGYNGYITWPKLGYDGEIPDNYWRKLPKPFRQKMGSKRNVQSLLAIPGGAEVWERYGGSIDLRFDLADGSPSMQVLNKYVEKRRSQPPRPHRSEQAPQGRANQREAARKAELDAQIAQAMATWR
jgi:hypothetical protein